jgi:PilZ domain-containing protein
MRVECRVDEQPVETTLYSLGDGVPRASDRRTGERHLTLFRVGSVIIDGRRELCLIKNISAGGMLIRAYCTLETGNRLSVELKHGEQIPGKVSWIGDSCAGIAFDSPVDVVELLAASMDGPRPRMPRVEVRCIASVRQESQVYGLLARDVSQGGIKVETDRKFEIGSDVVVTLPGLPPQQGVVRWSESGCYGITFNRLVALSDLVAWLHDQREMLRKAG